MISKDITVGNGLRPILQMGETWWWDNEAPYLFIIEFYEIFI